MDLMRRIIANTPAGDDCDHIRMLVDNNPKVPSRLKAIIEGSGPSPAPVLIEMARGLVMQGADFLAMPCNTAHHYHPQLADAVDVPVLNLMELVACHIAAADTGLKRVGLLASSALRGIALYEPWIEARDMRLMYPDTDAQTALMALIHAVKTGTWEHLGTAGLAAAVKQLEASGAQCLLVACTELSVIGAQLQSSLPVFDAADILAAAVIHEAKPPPAH